MATIHELIERAENESLDAKAKAAGLVIGLPGELYTLTLGRYRAIYIERIIDKWIVWRETYQTNRNRAVSSRTIAEAATLDYVLEQVARHLEYLSKFRRK